MRNLKRANYHANNTILYLSKYDAHSNLDRLLYTCLYLYVRRRLNSSVVSSIFASIFSMQVRDCAPVSVAQQANSLPRNSSPRAQIYGSTRRWISASSGAVSVCGRNVRTVDSRTLLRRSSYRRSANDSRPESCSCTGI